MKEKSIVSNIVFNVIYKFMNVIFPFITSIYISHIILAIGVGKVSRAQNIVQYFVLIAPLGIVNYGTREIARIRDSRAKTDKLFSELFWINFCSTIVCSISYYSIILFTDLFASDRVLFLIAGLPIVFNVINVEWYYQGYEEYGYIAVRSVIIKFISLIAMLLFVRNVNDYIVYAGIYACGIVGNYIFNAANLVKHGVKLQFDGLNFRKHLKPIFILLCSGISIELYTLVDTTMLGAMCTEEVVGYYTNSIKLVRIVVGLIAAIGGVLLPRLSYYRKNNLQEKSNELISNIVMLMLFLAIPSGIGIFSLADKLIPLLFGDSFIPAAGTVKIASFLIYVLGFSNLFGTQVLLSYNQEKKLLISTLFGAVSNIIMNSIWIPIYQQNGAVVASVISETLVTSLTIIFSLKYVKVKIKPKFIICVCSSAVVMGIVILFLSYIKMNLIMNLLLCIFSGGLIYILCNILEKNPILIVFNSILKKREKMNEI